MEPCANDISHDACLERALYACLLRVLPQPHLAPRGKGLVGSRYPREKRHLGDAVECHQGLGSGEPLALWLRSSAHADNSIHVHTLRLPGWPRFVGRCRNCQVT